MADVNERVEAEFECIERVVAELPADALLDNLSSLELAGVACLIHNFYNGIENILKQMVVSRGRKVPQEPSWHRDLVNMMVSDSIISDVTAEQLRRYLAFRHFFSQGYSFDLDKERIIPLVKDIPSVLTGFKSEINKALGIG